MTERITQTYIEDAVSGADSFVTRERGVGIDGAEAANVVADRVVSAQEAAEVALTSIPHPKLDGLYVPLSKHNASHFEGVRMALTGYLVLVPSAIVDPKNNTDFYPAVVSEDGLKHDDMLRLHVLKQPYRQELGYGASVVLSAAGQSETPGIGHHGHQGGDGVEAEHFATLLAAGNDASIRNAWQNGVHINHTWRTQANDSVLSKVNGTVFGEDVRQQTITYTKQHFEHGKAMILWHEGMRDSGTGMAETAAKDQALVVIQALGYEALRTQNPASLDQVKEMLV